MKKKENLRVVPTKNYVILGIIIIVTILLTFYINAWIKTYKENLYSESVLTGKVKEVNINELKEPFYEVNEVVLYVGYTNDKKLYNEEKEMLKIIKKEDLNEWVMYLNVTGEVDYTSILEKRFGNKSVNITKAPLLIYISKGETKEVKSIKNINTLSDKFEDLIKDYNIGNNY